MERRPIGSLADSDQPVIQSFDVLPHAACAPPLAAARTTTAAKQQEPTGAGVLLSYQFTTFGGVSSNATGPPLVTSYDEVLEASSMGFGMSIILRRPPTGVLASGDTYALLGVEMASFPTRDSAVDDMTVLSFWLDAKTMLTPVGATGTLKPYVLVGLGLARIFEVTAGGGSVVLFDSSFVSALRGKVGLELRSGNLGVFVDVGAQMTGAPSPGPTMTFSEGEPMIVMPIRVGVAVNF